jgi:hypothetical protein
LLSNNSRNNILVVPLVGTKPWAFGWHKRLVRLPSSKGIFDGCVTDLTWSSRRLDAPWVLHWWTVCVFQFTVEELGSPISADEQVDIWSKIRPWTK